MAAIRTNGEVSATVVIAEDNATSRRCIKNHLEALGYKVVGAASNGEEALSMVTEMDPTLVVLDYKMPKLNGIEAARAISAVKTLPIILITGHSTEELASEAIDAGVFAYIIKPVSRKHLVPAIKMALTRYDEFQALKEEVTDLKLVLESRKLIERAKGILMKRCKIDEEAAFRLLQTQSQKENRKMQEVAEMVISASKMI